MKLGAEQLEQIALMDWVRSRADLRPFTFHIANERRVSPLHGSILKRMGVVSGVSDIFVGIPRASYHGMFLELKAGKNKPTPNQVQFMEDMRTQGYHCVWCIGFEAARDHIETYIISKNEGFR